MRLCEGLFQEFDRRRFLGIRIWEFIGYSLGRPYAHYVARELALRHPLKFVRGFLAYRRFVRERSAGGGVFRAAPEGWGAHPGPRVAKAAAEVVRPVLAVGYCQKPLERNGSGVGCPAGRFTHVCRYLDGLDLTRPDGDLPAPACKGCLVRIMGREALRAGVSFNIMTTALDVARDIMVPAINNGGGRMLLAVCPITVEIAALPLLVCGIDFSFVTYNAGNCQDYATWLLADRSHKLERAILSGQGLATVKAALQGLAQEAQKQGQAPGRCFARRGNTYIPVPSPTC